MNDDSATAHVEGAPRAEPPVGSSIHIGRYALHRQIARGGMATIHIARLMGDEGFSRIVAAKRLLPEFAEDAEFVAMFLDEARIASRVHHRNVVPVLDVVNTGDEVVLVQEYVHGVPLHWLLNRARQTKALVPVNVAVSIACQVLAGLHAAHETTDELGQALDVVHRDVSPQNVMVAVDGSARLLDFGVAKSLMAAHVTREGTYKGKLAYSAPEQLRGNAVRQSDIYSLTVLLWELLVGHRMHRTAQAEAELVATIMTGKLPTVTEALMADRDCQSLPADHWRDVQLLEPMIKQGLAVEIEDRFQTAVEMEEALVSVVRPASSNAVAQWLKGLGKEYMDKHDKVLAAEEASWRRTTASQTGIRRGQPPTVPLRPGGTRLGSLPRPDDASAGSSPGSAGGSGHAISAAGASSPGARGQLPHAPARGPYALVALLSLLVVALAAGIVIVVTRKGDAGPPAAQVAPAAAPAGVAPAGVAPAAAAPVPVAAPAAAPPAARTVEQAPAAPADEPSISIGEVEATPAAPTAKAGAGRAPAKQSARVIPAPPRATARTGAAPAKAASEPAELKAPAETKAPSEIKAPEPKAPAKESCNPPYYYEGTKKIFKPACL